MPERFLPLQQIPDHLAGDQKPGHRGDEGHAAGGGTTGGAQVIFVIGGF